MRSVPSGCTKTDVDPGRGTQRVPSGRACERDTRQVRPTRHEADVERELRARPLADRRLRSRTPGIAWPSRPRFEARTMTGRQPSEVDLVGRRPDEPGVRR